MAKTDLIFIDVEVKIDWNSQRISLKFNSIGLKIQKN